MKRGYSNVESEQTAPWPDVPEAARIPIWGGAQVNTVKELPPLALRRDEWLEIGTRMGWLEKVRLDLM
jgi:hypothetical protein